jgi:hypothetical protein
MAATDTAARLGRLTARAAPAICTTTILAAARAWNADGAEHSFGAAFLMGAFAAGAGAAGFVSACKPHGDPAITALGLGIAGTFAMAGVAAYSDPLPLPILLWLIATIAAYAMAARYWRDDRRAELQHLRAMERDRAKHRHGERVEEIRGRTAEKVAETTHDALQAAQMLAAWQHRKALDVHPDLAGFGIAADILLGDKEKQPSEK